MFSYINVGLYFFANTSPLAANPLLPFCNKMTSLDLNVFPVTGHAIFFLFCCLSLSFLPFFFPNTMESYTSFNITAPLGLITITGCVVILFSETAQMHFPPEVAGVPPSDVEVLLSVVVESFSR